LENGKKKRPRASGDQKRRRKKQRCGTCEKSFRKSRTRTHLHAGELSGKEAENLRGPAGGQDAAGGMKGNPSLSAAKKTMIREKGWVTALRCSGGKKKKAVLLELIEDRGTARRQQVSGRKDGPQNGQNRKDRLWQREVHSSAWKSGKGTRPRDADRRKPAKSRGDRRDAAQRKLRALVDKRPPLTNWRGNESGSERGPCLTKRASSMGGKLWGKRWSSKRGGGGGIERDRRGSRMSREKSDPRNRKEFSDEGKEGCAFISKVSCRASRKKKHPACRHAKGDNEQDQHQGKHRDDSGLSRVD